MNDGKQVIYSSMFIRVSDCDFLWCFTLHISGTDIVEFTVALFIFRYCKWVGTVASMTTIEQEVDIVFAGCIYHYYCYFSWVFIFFTISKFINVKIDWTLKKLTPKLRTTLLHVMDKLLTEQYNLGLLSTSSTIVKLTCCKLLVLKWYCWELYIGDRLLLRFLDSLWSFVAVRWATLMFSLKQ